MVKAGVNTAFMNKTSSLDGEIWDSALAGMQAAMDRVGYTTLPCPQAEGRGNCEEQIRDCPELL